jgi:hypothetical protein
VVSTADLDVRSGPVNRLEVRIERVNPRSRLLRANRHPFRERPRGLRSRDEVPPHPPDTAEPRRDRAEHLLQRPAARPPELVGVAVDDPVRTEARRRQSRHPSDHVDLRKRIRKIDAMHVSGAGVSLEDLGRAVRRAVVRGDHEVHATRQVETDVVVDDVRLIPDEQCHHESHG